MNAHHDIIAATMAAAQRSQAAAAAAAVAAINANASAAAAAVHESVVGHSSELQQNASAPTPVAISGQQTGLSGVSNRSLVGLGVGVGPNQAPTLVHGGGSGHSIGEKKAWPQAPY